MRAIPLILLSIVLLPALPAGTIYSVSLNTAALPTAGTFYLDFQFFDGSGFPPDLNNNAVAISNLAIGGGATAGVPAFTGGGAGDAATGFTLNDTQFFEVLQAFHPGSVMTFQVSLTTALNPGGTPDQLSLAILDSSLSELPTNGVANELFSITDGRSGAGDRRSAGGGAGWILACQAGSRSGLTARVPNGRVEPARLPHPQRHHQHGESPLPPHRHARRHRPRRHHPRRRPR